MILYSLVPPNSRTHLRRQACAIFAHLLLNPFSPTDVTFISRSLEYTAASFHVYPSIEIENTNPEPVGSRLPMQTRSRAGISNPRGFPDYDPHGLLVALLLYWFSKTPRHQVCLKTSRLGCNYA